MKYIVYLTVNLKSKVNGLNRIYIGVHKTKNPEIDDLYRGCGCYCNKPSSYMYPKTSFQRAFKKYGPNAFVRTVLYVFDNAEEAYQKEKEIVTFDFIKQSHVYNMTIGGEWKESFGRPIYQFDLKGNLLKYWELTQDASDFYGYDNSRFTQAMHYKCSFLDCFWSRESTINLDEYVVRKRYLTPIYLYNLDGKLVNEFPSIKECAEFVNRDPCSVGHALDRSSVIDKKYYVSEKLTDLFVPKPRKQYEKCAFYLYDKDSTYLGSFVGKSILARIGTYSWRDIQGILTLNDGWFKDYFISLTPVEKVPDKFLRKNTAVEVYDKTGNLIEILPTLKEVRQKYNVKSHQLKDIRRGDKYVGDYIFRYCSKSRR